MAKGPAALCDEYRLTARQREIVMLISQGLSNKEIARRVNISAGTVKVHLVSIYRKVGVANRTALTSYVFRNNLAPNG